MKFELEHDLPQGPDETWRVITSDAYEAASGARTGLDRRVIESKSEDGKRTRRLHITSERELPRPIAKVLGGSVLSYELVETYEDHRRFSTWEVIPSKLSDRVVAKGTYVIEAGRTSDTCVRRIKGEVRVSIALVGSKIEDLIGSEVRSSYDKSTDFLRDYLRRESA